MRIPNILAAPVARRQHDGDFLELARLGRLEAQIVVQRPPQVSHFGAAQIDVERAGLGLAPGGELPIREGALIGRELRISERLETVAARVEFRRGGGDDRCSEQRACGAGGQKLREHLSSHDGSSLVGAKA